MKRRHMKWCGRVLGVLIIVGLTLVMAGCNATVGVGVAYPGAYGPYGGPWGGGVYVGGPIYGGPYYPG